MNIGPGHVAVLSGIVFAIGILGLVIRRDAFGLLISLAILLLASVIAFAGFTVTGGGSGGAPQGEVVALAVIVVCASQSLLGAAVVALVRRRQESLDVDELDEVEV
jgi:NADH-quinone oxidoreductase subunit K